MTRTTWTLLTFPILLCLAPGVQAMDTGLLTQSVSITSNGHPALELYRDADRIRYRLNDDWALSLSLGIAPSELVNRRLPWTQNNRWLPHFSTYQSLLRFNRDPGRRFGRIQWFWTAGTQAQTNLGSGRAFLVGRRPLDIDSEFIHEISLQTKVGFIVPFGKRWLLGSSLTLDRRLGNDSPVTEAQTSYLYKRDNSDAGAFVGFQWSY